MRDYKKEYREYHSSTKQKKLRALRNKANRTMSPGPGKEVDHKVPLSKGGSNGESNWRVVSRETNRKKYNKTANVRPRVALWLHDGNGNILVQDDRSKGYSFKFPGGGIDPGQSVNDAAAREALEEVGYTLASEPRAIPGVRAKTIKWRPKFLEYAAKKGRGDYTASKHYHRLALAGERDRALLGSEGDALNASWVPIKEILEETRLKSQDPNNDLNYFDEERLRVAEIVNKILNEKTASIYGPLSAFMKVSEKGVATKTNPDKWEAAKREAKAKMGGKHSARAMQLATQIYKKKGGGYSGKKPSATTNKLKKWTKQDWQWSGEHRKKEASLDDDFIMPALVGLGTGYGAMSLAHDMGVKDDDALMAIMRAGGFGGFGLGRNIFGSPNSSYRDILYPTLGSLIASAPAIALMDRRSNARQYVTHGLGFAGGYYGLNKAIEQNKKSRSKTAGKGVYAPARTLSALKSTESGKKKLREAVKKKNSATDRGEQYANHGLHKGKDR